jgi:hypothetical protein
MWGNITTQELSNNVKQIVFTLALPFWQVLRFSSWKSKPLEVKALFLQNIKCQLLSDKASNPRITESSSASFFYIKVSVGVRNVKHLKK